MIDTHDILETINMIDNENLDVRTITMGISLLDCIDSDIDKACTKVYDKICSYAENLVKTGEDISREYGIPIVNKRIAVTPIAMLAGANPGASPVRFAKALDRAAKTVGVNFIGGYSALVHKGFAPGDYALIESIPEALAETEFVCSSVNVGSTKAGINMDAVKKMGHIVKGSRRPHRGPRLHRCGKARCVLQRTGGQPLHGGRFPRRRRTGLRHQRGRFRPGRCARSHQEGKRYR